MKRLLVTGASGFLGWNVCCLAPDTWEVWGTSFSHPVTIPNATIYRVDVTDYGELKQMVKTVRPDAVIHTASASDPNFCQVNPEASLKINVDAAVHLSRLCADRGIPYVFTSSDLVFDGQHAPYADTDTPNPVNIYGEHKVLAEQGVMKAYSKSAICRMPLMFGRSGPVAESFIQPMIKAMVQGQGVKLFVDEFRTPVSGKTAAHGLFLALEKVSGLIHLGGTERISRYDLGALVAKTVHIGNAKLIACRQADVPMPAPRPKDVSLDSSKAFALGYAPKPLAEELEEIYESMHSHEDTKAQRE